METRYQVRKVVVCFLLIVLGFWALGVRAEYVNLEGSDVIRQGICTVFKEKYNCFIVTHKGDIYVVMVDARGELYQYKIVDEKPVLIWARNGV
jgi:hypothetical protein